ncbi:MAG: trypsin-like peptidase domain-containing protein [Antricoccus sp.]
MSTEDHSPVNPSESSERPPAERTPTEQTPEVVREQQTSFGAAQPTPALSNERYLASRPFTADSGPSSYGTPRMQGQGWPTHPSAGSPYGPAASSTAPGPSAPAARPRRVGLIITAAVLAGLVGGVGGSAGYNAITGGNSSVTASQIKQTSTQASSKALDGSVAAVAKLVTPSVVQINVKGAQQADTGTGIILTKDGDIVTNNHVIAAAAGQGSSMTGTITVAFSDGTTTSATIVGRDPVTDIAVIKAANQTKLTPAVFADSSALQVGQDVVAVGSPFGLADTVTSGVVSALNRPVASGDGTSSSATTVFPAIQTDAAINPGNSGGPLVDMNGSVIGINAAIYNNGSSSSGQGTAGSVGVGFAIPSNLAKSVADQILAGKTVEHAKLGVQVTDSVESDGITTNGAKIAAVTAGSAAAKAGMQAGDVVTAAGGVPVRSAESLIATVRAYQPGQQIKLTITRGGQSQSVTVTLDSDGGKLTS